LDLGNHRYAIYAHLQPGKLRVHLGEKVVAGQILGYLGNSGNSDEPHLHFQLMDANSPLGAEGIPYHYTSFTVTGVVADPDALDQGKPWPRPVKDAPTVRHRQFPVDNAVIDF
jgi:murein DD-endopeptidase MepM/ murein hydrolase activator NlpD